MPTHEDEGVPAVAGPLPGQLVELDGLPSVPTVPDDVWNADGCESLKGQCLFVGAFEHEAHSSKAVDATAVEVEGPSSAAALDRSEGQAPKFPPHVVKKLQCSFFVKTLEGQTKMCNVKENMRVSELVETVQEGCLDCYVQYNGKVLGWDCSLDSVCRDERSTFRLNGRSRGGANRRLQQPDIPGSVTLSVSKVLGQPLFQCRSVVSPSANLLAANSDSVLSAKLSPLLEIFTWVREQAVFLHVVFCVLSCH